jgi:ribonucleoside-diphosphate reductase alpha chain
MNYFGIKSALKGYLKLCAVLQKYIDQGISVNTSYNPQYYDDEKIPMSEMLQHLIMCYKYGLKQLYYLIPLMVKVKSM